VKNLENGNNLFTSDDITVRCPKNMNWENMREVKDGRFCEGCYEKLYYVGGYTKGEVKRLQRIYGSSICVGVKTLVSVNLVSGLSSCTKKDKKICNNMAQNITKYPVVVGLPIF